MENLLYLPPTRFSLGGSEGSRRFRRGGALLARPIPVSVPARSKNPELAALRILKTSLDVAEAALVAACPNSCEASYPERCRSEQEAYASSILYQIDALSAVLNEYAESIWRSQQWRNREPSADEIAF